MTPSSSSNARPRREHLIEIAYALFNRHGFHQAGIDMIMRQSGVSKTTLYKYFPSKEDLVLAVLRLRSARILARMRERLDQLLSARPDATALERVSAILEVTREWIEGGAFFGCNFARAVAEYTEPGHPIRKQARAHKLALLALIKEQLEDCPGNARSRLASEILMIIEGSVSVAQMGCSPAPIAAARRLIELVMKDQERE